MDCTCLVLELTVRLNPTIFVYTVLLNYGNFISKANGLLLTYSYWTILSTFLQGKMFLKMLYSIKSCNTLPKPTVAIAINFKLPENRRASFICNKAWCCLDPLILQIGCTAWMYIITLTTADGLNSLNTHTADGIPRKVVKKRCL